MPALHPIVNEVIDLTKSTRPISNSVICLSDDEDENTVNAQMARQNRLGSNEIINIDDSEDESSNSQLDGMVEVTCPICLDSHKRIIKSKRQVSYSKMAFLYFGQGCRHGFQTVR